MVRLEYYIYKYIYLNFSDKLRGFSLRIRLLDRRTGIFLVYDFWNPHPTPPPPINFVHGSDKNFLNLT